MCMGFVTEKGRLIGGSAHVFTKEISIPFWGSAMASLKDLIWPGFEREGELGRELGGIGIGGRKLGGGGVLKGLMG